MEHNMPFMSPHVYQHYVLHNTSRAYLTAAVATVVMTENYGYAANVACLYFTVTVYND